MSTSSPGHSHPAPAVNPNLHLMAEYNKLWKLSHIDQADKVLAENFARYGRSGEFKGIPAFKRYVIDFLQAFPDTRFTVEDVIHQGDKVVLRYGFTATHQGPFLGIAPTGNKVKIQGSAIYKIVNGKLQELWDFLDMLGLFQQLGVPAPP